MTVSPNPANGWPTLPINQWIETIEALHLWTQIVGKIRLGHAPSLNHSWSVPLRVSTKGLRTSMIRFGNEGVELGFDLNWRNRPHGSA